jgi:hypothetical protein
MNIIQKCCSLLFMMAAGTMPVLAQEDTVAAPVVCLSCVCKKDVTPAAVMISHLHQRGEWMFSYRYMSMNARGIQQNGTAVSNDQVYNQYLMSSDKMRMDMHMLMAMYGLGRRITLMGMAEYNRSSMNMNAPEGSMHMHPGMDMSTGMDHEMKTSGFGDVSLTALYGLVYVPYHLVIISGGLSVPTGSIQTKGGSGSMYPDQRYPYMMQRGSGTWDVLPGLTYTFQKNKLMASSQLYATIRTGYNSVGYKLGNKAAFNNWVAYRWFNWMSTSLRAEATTSGSIKGADPDLYIYTEPAANPVNYGGQAVFGYAGINFYFLNRNKIAVEGGVPLYQKLNGIQSTLYTNINFNYSILL